MSYQQPETFQHISFKNKALSINHYDFMTGTTMPHWHNHYEILRCIKGINRVHINGQFYVCQAGDILFIPSNSLHSILPQGPGGYDALVIGDQMTGKLLKLLPKDQIGAHIQHFLHNSQIILKASSHGYDRVKNCLLTIFDTINQEGIFQEAIVISELLRLFTYTSHLQWRDKSMMEISSPKRSDNIDLIKNVINYLEDHYREKITIKAISDMYAISEQHFSRLFKSYTGKTFLSYLTHYRLEQANKLLLSTTLPITRIPELTGFCNSNYFSRVYKNYYGFSPSNARRRLKSSF